MSTLNSTPKLCHRCTKDRLTSACDGCHVSFCVKHLTEHQQELYQTIDNISEENDSLKRELSQRGIEKILLEQIDTWEKETINKIRSTSKTARTDIKQLTEESTNRLISIMNKLSNELHKNQKDHQYIEDNLNRWTKQIEELKKELQIPPNIESFLEDDSTIVRLIKIKSSEKIEPNQTDPSPQTESRRENRSSKMAPSSTSPSDSSAALNKSESIANVNISSSQSSFYPSLTFGFNQSSNQVIQQLFKYLMRLDPMDKN
ncbi:unnamed protein product, partial [Rotaria sordida]